MDDAHARENKLATRNDEPAAPKILRNLVSVQIRPISADDLDCLTSGQRDLVAVLHDAILLYDLVGGDVIRPRRNYRKQIRAMPPKAFGEVHVALSIEQARFDLTAVASRGPYLVQDQCLVRFVYESSADTEA